MHFARLQLEKPLSPRVLEMRDRINEYFLSLAATAVPFLDREDHDNRIGRLESELTNGVEALRRVAVTDPVHVAALTASLWRFWWTRGHAAIGLEILTSVLPACRHDRNVYARAAVAAGHLERHLGHFQRKGPSDSNGAREWFQQALEHADDLALRSEVLRMFGLLEWHLKGEAASGYLEQALAAALESRDELRIADAYYERANNLLRETEPDKAIHDIDYSLSLYRSSGDLTKTGTAFLSLANTLYKAGRLDQARRNYAEALALFARTRFKLRLAMIFERVARIAAEDDAAPAHAASLLGMADELHRQTGSPIPGPDLVEYLVPLRKGLEERLTPSGFEDFRQMGTSMTLSEVIALAEKHLEPATVSR